LSRTDILSEIKTVEAEADAKIARAEADKKTAIAEARRDSVKRIQEAESDIRNNNESVIAKEQAAVNAEKEEKLAAGRKEAESLETSSKKKIKKVNDFLVKEFERAIDVAS
jgi:V/A-type H+-transporting ATPase subunit G/H